MLNSFLNQRCDAGKWCATVTCANVRLWCVRWGVLSSPPVAYTGIAIACRRKKFFCKVTRRLREAVLILAIPDICANLVVLAILEVPTTSSKMKMTPAIHEFSKNSNFATQVLIAAFHRATVASLLDLGM